MTKYEALRAYCAREEDLHHAVDRLNEVLVILGITPVVVSEPKGEDIPVGKSIPKALIKTAKIPKTLMQELAEAPLLKETASRKKMSLSMKKRWAKAKKAGKNHL